MDEWMGGWVSDNHPFIHPSNHPESMRPKLLTIAIFAAIVGLGALARFHAIGRKSLWLDEAATMDAVDASFAEVFRGVKDHDAHPPLYYLALRAWSQRSPDGAWARAFSAAASVATLAVFWLLARELLPRAAALAATAVLAVSAYQVYFAQEARHYALAAFFVTLSWYFLALLLVGKVRWRFPLWLGLAAANTAALYTFYYTAFAAAAQLVALLSLWAGRLCPAGGGAPAHNSMLWRDAGRKLVARWLLWQLVPAAAFAFWVPVILERLKRLGSLEPPGGATVRSVEGLCDTAAQFACGFIGQLAGGSGPAFRAAAAALGVVVLAAALWGLGWRGAQRPRPQRAAAVVALAWLLCPVLFLAAVPLRGHTYEPKHLFFASPALALAAGVVASLARDRLKALAIPLIAIVLALNAFSLERYYRPGVEKENWRDAVLRFAELVQAGDVVTFTPPMDELPFVYYYRPLGGPRLWRVWAEPEKEPFRGGEMAAAHEQRRTVWVFEGASNVEKPNPQVLGKLLHPEQYEARREQLPHTQGKPAGADKSQLPRFRPAFEWGHSGLIGTVRLWQLVPVREGEPHRVERRDAR
ncbi:MAG: hypothetical protein FJ291_29530 [Planctomycetes bacterium]|nr:hypothetical protein [Planctomycetota bacterium]